MQKPTNRSVDRKDEHDEVYRTAREKGRAIVAEIADCHRRGQPILVGTVSIDAIGRPDGLNFVRMHRRPATRGPRFSHFSAGRWERPQVSAIEDKLRPNRYKTSKIPMELFAYAVHDEPDLEIGSLEELQSAIVRHLPASVFRRAHIFDFGFRRHLYSHP